MLLLFVCVCLELIRRRACVCVRVHGGEKRLFEFFVDPWARHHTHTKVVVMFCELRACRGRSRSIEQGTRLTDEDSVSSSHHVTVSLITSLLHHYEACVRLDRRVRTIPRFPFRIDWGALAQPTIPALIGKRRPSDGSIDGSVDYRCMHRLPTGETIRSRRRRTTTTGRGLGSMIESIPVEECESSPAGHAFDCFLPFFPCVKHPRIDYSSLSLLYTIMVAAAAPRAAGVSAAGGG
jgi:hypothetical protein